MNEADVRLEIKELMRVLIELGDYSREDLIDLVDEATDTGEAN
jgi:hypothetical protein